MKITINADGASRGNPGQASIGATLKDENGRLIKAISERIGRATNNQAEYRAVIAALSAAAKMGADEVRVLLDSELVVKQVTGRYQVKNVGLKPLYDEVKRLQAGFKSFSITHVLRAKNSEADALANQAFK